jgi:hypothetical protein
MQMAGKLSRSWALIKQSWGVLRLNKRLMVLPVLSSIACLAVMATFALPFVFSETLQEQAMQVVNQHKQPAQVDDPDTLQVVVPALLTFTFYLATNFVIVFFNTALACCALDCFAGREARLSAGLRAATARLPQILGWALLAATVGTVLKMIEERVPMVGKFVIRFIGLAWAVVTFLVVPILAAEQLGPIRAVKRSTELLRKSWGEALTGQITFGAMQLVFVLPFIAALLVAGFLAATSAIWLALTIVALAVAYIVALMIVFGTLQQIFLAAVYQYAAEGRVPAGFSEDLIKSAFRRKE